MYRDRSLQPGETVKLIALGLLIEAPRTYADLANDIRYFTARIVGPSLDLLGSSLEILRLEGWIAPQENKAKENRDNTGPISLTDSGYEQFLSLMNAPLRIPLNDSNRLALLTKLRFLSYLPEETRLDQIDLIEELVEKEQAWNAELARDFPQTALGAWVEMESRDLSAKRAWLHTLSKTSGS